MRTVVVASSLLACSLVAQAQLMPRKPFSPDHAARSGVQFRYQQKPIMDSSPAIQLPPSSDGNAPPPPPTGDVILSDVIGNERRINIFAGFTRDISTVSDRLDNSSENTTVLAPINSAITSLPRKPWEDPREYAALGANAYEGADGEDRAHRNLRRFTEAHVVPQSPWKEGDKVATVGGAKIWWEVEDGKAYVQPGDVEVERVVSRVKNGEVWILKGVLNYAP
ncbi:uncharacterized protein MYCFIDRAFT_212276 [Pseudocercospora fijiensis CIRAD86]|uniref:FAS1 domain-containing protein n=1 Tax=Pseudocercospora fijiensis (strain CIRAD86) TaxID=383855 RepID=M2ZKQ4_PSEFD|nr:uncharacterized protein MYCFIDRAFT_212276 [Pseudocercospora fijiensis CIRAD86]EME79654.1 hypothetical protein MYCFIDRAFT_212276 [Pseudocercospora fijiensis CIRAD86]